MSFCWEDLLTVADELIETSPKNTNHEAYYRAAVNRAYYGAYSSACQWLEEKEGFVPDPGESHGTVFNRLDQLGGEARKVAIKLKAIRPDRIDADYHIQVRIDEKKSKKVLQFARAVCASVKILSIQ